MLVPGIHLTCFLRANSPGSAFIIAIISPLFTPEAVSGTSILNYRMAGWNNIERMVNLSKTYQAPCPSESGQADESVRLCMDMYACGGGGMCMCHTLACQSGLAGLDWPVPTPHLT